MTYDPNARRDTPLALKLKKLIRRDGPITVHDYMQACLHDPEHGYYVKQPAIGAAGDFITAPEISQVFGELIGLWCAVVWWQMGAPEKINLVELGPGRGTLMKDVLRASKAVPAFRNAVAVHLIETSTALAVEQRVRLAGCDVEPTWHRAPDTVPADASLYIANEFLDAVPVTQSVLQSGEGVERGVGLDSSGQLTFMRLADNPRPDERLPATAEGRIFEQRPHIPLLDAFRSCTERVPMAALVLDYGHTERAPGDTLQAVRNHVAEDPLCSPGEADLSAQVDFADFKEQAEALGLAVDGPTTQAEFLGRLGIIERASKLMSANPVKAAGIEAGVARLIAPNGMGTRFKAIGVRTSNIPKLPGF